MGEHSNELGSLGDLKIRTLEIPFTAIWALNYELQFDFKKGKTLEIMPYF